MNADYAVVRDLAILNLAIRILSLCSYLDKIICCKH